MHSLSPFFLCVSASLLGSTLALPTTPSSFPFDRRSCQISYPTSMIEFTPYDTSKSLTDFCIAPTRVRYARFDNIPPAARGACQLEFVFPPGYSVAGPGSHQVNVWKTDRPVEDADTWVSAPNTITLFGTVTLNSKPFQETRLVVNSGECASMKNFKFTATDNSNEASVTYTQQYTPAVPVAGMRIVHSC